MISGTSFVITRWEDVADEVARRNGGVAAVSDLERIGAKCAAGQALALSGPDGIVVVELLGGQTGLVLWIWIAAGAHAGAFRRAESALEAIARDMGASTIAFRPARAGWQRLAGQQWQRRGECLERSVHG